MTETAGPFTAGGRSRTHPRPRTSPATAKRAAARGTKLRRTQEERSTETRKRLVEAAIELIHQEGYANLTTPEIAALAGVSRGALQHHFGTRYELIASVNDRLTAAMLALGEEVQTVNLPLVERVDHVLRRYWSVYASPAYFVILNISLGLKSGDPLARRVRQNFADIYRRSDPPWLTLFADTGLAREELVSLRRFTLATLRGLTMARFLGIQRETPAAELDVLRQTLLNRLGGLPSVGAAAAAKQRKEDI